MRTALAGVDQVVGADDIGGVHFTTRRGEPWIVVPKPGKVSKPANLYRLKDSVERRGGTIDLLDFLKEADYLTDLTEAFTSVATREVIAGPVRCRLQFVLIALRTNMGIEKLAERADVIPQVRLGTHGSNVPRSVRCGRLVGG